jgi:hypothetical protein
MAKRRKKSGKSPGVLSQIVVFLTMGALLVSFFNIPTDPSVTGIWNQASAKSDTLKVWFNNCIPNAIKGNFSGCKVEAASQSPSTTWGGGSDANGTSNPDVTQLKNTLASLKVGDKQNVNYNRDEWKHWIGQKTSSCGSWDTREQVLYDEAVKDDTLKMTDSAGNETTDVSKACKVTAGTWKEPYKGVTVTDPKKLDIDHVIPLGYAASHGGQNWSSEKKQQYANDLSYAGHLMAVDASSNRKKGDKGPSQWMPANSEYHCQYAIQWITIANNYQLTLEQKDVDTLTEALNTCK